MAVHAEPIPGSSTNAVWSLEAQLDPGAYVLIGNLGGHYARRMWASFEWREYLRARETLRPYPFSATYAS
jgi:hypothetical protein